MCRMNTHFMYFDFFPDANFDGVTDLFKSGPQEVSRLWSFNQSEVLGLSAVGDTSISDELKQKNNCQF